MKIGQTYEIVKSGEDFYGLGVGDRFTLTRIDGQDDATQEDDKTLYGWCNYTKGMNIEWDFGGNVCILVQELITKEFVKLICGEAK